MRARGVLSVPAALGYWSPCLVAEAVGQLAAWSAMARADFRYRPLAGIAGDVRMGLSAGPGTTLDLRIAIEHSDEEAVAYSGSASMDGDPVLELERCVGPMFPMGDYDAPDAVRLRFEALCGAGAPPDRFEALRCADVEVIEHESGRRLHARATVPESAAFFADHFPRRPVYPATLLLDHQLGLAVQLAADLDQEADGGAPAVTRVSNAKMRSFVLPGQVVELESEVRSSAAGLARVALTARADGNRVSTARADLRSGVR